MFVNANQLKVAPPPINRSNSRPVLDMSAATAAPSQPVPLLQPLNVPRFIPHSTSHARDTGIDMTPPQASLPLMPSSTAMMKGQAIDWPGPGSRIASLLPPEHLGTPLVGQLQLRDEYTPTHIASAQAYPYASHNFWMGGTDQGLDLTLGLTHDDKTVNPELMKRRHVCPVCDKRFNRPSSLNTHMAVHTGAKPFVCQFPECGRRFSVSSNLRRHEKTHNVRPRDSHHGSPYGGSVHHDHQDSDHASVHSHGHSRRPSHMSHSSSSSFAGFSMTPLTTDGRRGTAYSDTQTPRQPPNNYAVNSLPSGVDYNNTPYHSYTYPLPQPQSQPPAQLTLPYPSSSSNSLPNSSHGHNDFEFLHSFPPPSAKSGGGLPPVSARSGMGMGMGLESYQVVKESAGGEGMSRSSSVSAPIEVIHTPPGMDEGEGESA